MRRLRLYSVIGILAIIVCGLSLALLAWWDPSGSIWHGPDDPAVRSDGLALVGHWQSVRIVMPDWPKPSTYPLDYYIAFSGKSLILYDPNCRYYSEDYSSPQEVYLDPHSLPKKFDTLILQTGGLRKGIYNLDGDTLQLALNRPIDRERPKNFDDDVYETLTLKRAKLQPVEYYEEKLLDEKFEWIGPASEIVTPRGLVTFGRLMAARALAFIGDDAVPALLRTLTNEAIDIDSICIALQAVGLPLGNEEYASAIYRRDPVPLTKWWAENREKTAMERSVLRVRIGLPPVDGVDFKEVKRRLWRTPSVWPKIVLGVCLGALVFTAVTFLTLRGLKRGGEIGVKSG